MLSLYSDRNALYILTILEAIEKIRMYADGFETADVFFQSEDQLRYNAVCYLLLAIGEESRKIEVSLKETQSFVAWDQIAGMRNRIAHDYRGVDKDVVFQVMQNELPILERAAKTLFLQLRLSNEEVARILQNPFFIHVREFLSHN